ncbi:MAG: DMT family transporter [Planctomycetes bacterium]|nr:DMT family transporter [Planctomycetota bacterium]
MRFRDRLVMALLAAIWGASFLFQRDAAPEFGPLALVQVRISVAAAFLLAIVVLRGQVRQLRSHVGAMVVLGAISTLVPFCLFTYATLSITAGFASVLNATAPLFAAVIGWLWLRESLSRLRSLGVAVGFAGVVILVSPKLALSGENAAIAAGLLASTCYGLSGHFSRHKLKGVAPLVLTCGSQIGASLMLLPFSITHWPAASPSGWSWGCAIVLGVVCTGTAYALYFQLVERVGAASAIVVTYLIPVFGILWGSLFRAEPVTPPMLLGTGVILAGTILVTGFRPSGSGSQLLKK